MRERWTVLRQVPFQPGLAGKRRRFALRATRPSGAIGSHREPIRIIDNLSSVYDFGDNQRDAAIEIRGEWDRAVDHDDSDRMK
jgi:hypothetical protein